MPYKGTSAFPRFLFNFCVCLPVYVTLIIPMTLFWNACAYPFKKAPKKEIQENKDKELEGKLDKKFNSSPYEIKTLEHREFDLVLFGATGFTGRLAAKYLASQYGDSIHWAIAGRNQEKLNEVKEEMLQMNADCEGIPILIADSSNIDELTKIAERTKVVISTVGPFVRYGTPLVAVCAHTGTNYCDITGEVHWVRKMIDKYDEIAS